MLFNSLQFFIFFGVVFGLYACLSHRWQNRLLLVASYFFYGAWDWRFLLLLIGSSTLDFFFAKQVARATIPTQRKVWLTASIATNLCVLGFFKYFNFFVGSLEALTQRLGVHLALPILHIVLPVGISFYTFQALSYTVDVYRKKVKPAEHWEDFALFVAFFPQLEAGPIERATNMLPQVQNPRTISDYGISHGAYLILWGLFQKVVIADNLSPLADSVFNGHPTSGVMVLLGIYAFALQIYCDFSGYSNMARGIAFMLGFRLMLNFRNPYFATNPSDFWQRWHISLSTWLRDYLYIPLGGNRGSNWLTYRNLLLTMLLGGLWHGAAWTFVLWGLYHGTLLIAHRVWSSLRGEQHDTVNTAFSRVIRIVVFFHFTCFGWLLFRASSVSQVIVMLRTLVGSFHITDCVAFSTLLTSLMLYGVPLFLMELWQYRSNNGLVAMTAPKPLRAILYLALVYGIVIFGRDHAQSFIYFQF